jgi:hypothetical protein
VNDSHQRIMQVVLNVICLGPHRDIYLIPTQQFDATSGSGRHKALRSIAREHAAHIQGMESINVLTRINILYDRSFVEMRR